MKYLLLATWLLASCATYTPDGPYVDKQVEPYVTKFMSIYGLEFITTDVILTDVDQDGVTKGSVFVGMCYPHLNYVELHLPSWRLLSPYKREFLVFHELGHCVMFQRHRNFDLTDGCVGSIMDPRRFPTHDCYTNHTRYYRAELRNHRKDK